jgi:hypothetical protein
LLVAGIEGPGWTYGVAMRLQPPSDELALDEGNGYR